MPGVGYASGAMTILNALFTGIGSAVGLPLGVEVVAEISKTAHGNPPTTPLVSEAIQKAWERWGSRGSPEIEVRIRSEIPEGQGLKSSSAVASAVLTAVADMEGVRPDPLEVALLSAQVGRAVGVSATGALDDALAGLVDGAVMTDNRTDSWILTRSISPDWGAVLFTTGARHRPSPELLELFRRHREEGSEVERRVRSGDLLGAIESNGALVEKVMGYDYTELRSRLHDAGALACGISGMGPALVAVGPRDRLAEMANELPVSGTKKFLARLGPARLPPQGDS